MQTVIFNADDFGISPGVTRGIVHCHTHGVLTSTSLMVDAPAAAEAAQLARAHPHLHVGLHWDLDDFDLDDPHAVRDELERQLSAAAALLGRAPTHLDSHHHAHTRPEVAAAAREIAARMGLPLRGASGVHYIGGFYAQWEEGIDELEHVSLEAIASILRSELAAGWNEIGCHPGYLDSDFASSYREARPAELATLTDPGLRAELESLGLRHAGFGDYA